MGIWTTNAGNNYKINIGQDQICKMKEAGARFCWFKDNPGINNENNEIYFFLTKRTDELKHHKGQISLPGGTQEGNEKLIDTALRETQEEIGINKTSISIIGTITPLFVPVTGFMIYPFIGYSLYKLNPKPDPVEVATIFSVNISDLLNEENRTTEQRNIRGYDVQVPYFKLNDYQVWGATSMILSEFRDLIKYINEK